jgi:hypothetical protein
MPTARFSMDGLFVKCSLLGCLIAAVPVGAVEPASETRLDEVAKRGAQVMPFDLTQTTHVFTKTEQGGVQQVIVKDPAQGEQIRRIREHLSKIAAEFAQGDFSDPAKIHGEAMPGLAELRAAKSGAIRITYGEIAAGAQIDYATDEPGLVEAIHRWFDAQLSDHARHAVGGHPHHLMHGR